MANTQPDQDFRASSHRIKSGVWIGVCLMLLVTPWFFGGVSLRVQSVLLATSAVLLVVETVRMFNRSSSPAVVAIPSTMFLLVAGIGLGIFQLVPFQKDLASTFAAGSARWQASVQNSLRDVGQPDHGNGEIGQASISETSVTRSLYPPSTRENVALLFLVTGVFWLSARCFVSDRYVVGFLIALAACGLVLALFGLIQRFTWNGQIYWRFPLTMGGGPFGPFVNRNNGGGFLNLCLAGGIGTYVWLISRSSLHRPQRDDFGASHLWGMAAIVVTAGAVLASASRGSILSLLVGSVSVFALMMARRGQRSQAMGILFAGVVAVLMVVWLGEFAEVKDRFNELSNSELQRRTRALNWTEASRSLPDFWGLGSGLGTYRFVYLPFQDRFNTAMHYYAENQYVQALTDGGVVALTLILLAIVSVGWAVVCLFRLGDRVSVALAAAGLFGLVTQVVGGTFDFGLYLPANGMLLAAICGAVTGRLANRSDRAKQGPRDRSTQILVRTMHPIFVMGLGLTLAVGSGFGAVEMWRAADVQDIVGLGLRGRIAEQRDDAALVKLVNRANAAIRRRADDSDGHRVLAELWMQRYRVAVFRSTRQSEPWIDENDTWLMSSLIATNRSLHDVPREKRLELLGRIRNEEATIRLLKPAFYHAQAAQRACPWQPQTYLALATLTPFTGDGDSSKYLVQARRFSGGDPALWYRIGLLERFAGRDALAIQSWKRTLQLTRQYEAAILSEFANEMTLELVEELTPQDLERRLGVVYRLRPDFDTIATEFAEATVARSGAMDSALLPRQIAALAAIFATLDRHKAAAERWQLAIDRAGYGQTKAEWHAGLAESLLGLGERERARKATLEGLKLFPDEARLHQLHEKCSNST